MNLFSSAWRQSYLEIRLAPCFHAGSVQEIAGISLQIRMTFSQDAEPVHLSKPQSFAPGDAPIEDKAQQDYQLAERGQGGGRLFKPLDIVVRQAMIFLSLDVKEFEQCLRQQVVVLMIVAFADGDVLQRVVEQFFFS